MARLASTKKLRPDVEALNTLLTGRSDEDLICMALVSAACLNDKRIQRMHDGKGVMDQGDMNGLAFTFFALGIGLGAFKRKQLLPFVE